jgi:predicted RNA-binding Zn-ribbon protein involved in translation (DUF1610 family)
MSRCSHKTLTLLKERRDRLRCKKCHLIISADELASGCCPECYAVNGERRYDFEGIEPKGDELPKYRCDQCGAVIEWKGNDEMR